MVFMPLNRLAFATWSHQQGTDGASAVNIIAMAGLMAVQQAAMIADIGDVYWLAWIAPAVAPFVLLLAETQGQTEAAIAE